MQKPGTPKGHSGFLCRSGGIIALSIIMAGYIKTVSENLGHATVSFTLDKYGHVTEKMRKDSADRMQRYIDSVGG